MSTTLDTRTLYSALESKLGLSWISGEEHQDEPIHVSSEDDKETSLVGHLNLISQHRIQILGKQELDYLDSLKKNSRNDAVSQLFSGTSHLVIVTHKLAAPDYLQTAAIQSNTPLLSATVLSEDAIQILNYYLTSYFAKNITLHGVFMEVMGTGVLITGDASIGKSELALELLTRGHRLIADDAPEFTRTSPETLNGTCPEMLRDFLEVRGLGILNVRSMFGASAIKQHRNLRLIIVLQDIDESTETDRLHGSRRMRSIQDVEITEVTLPVGPGRNLAVLVEAAVRNHILISKGYDASEAFIERQKRRLEQAYT